MKFFVTIAILVLVSCSRNYNNVTSIMLPDDMKLLSGNYRKQYNGINDEVRMIAYYDSSFCTNCVFKNFHIWSGLINSIESQNGRASIVFIFAPKQSDLLKVERMVKKYVVDYPVYIDTAYSFGAVNPNLRQSFFGIIDENNNIVMSGYPFDSSKKLKKYYEKFRYELTIN